MTAPELLAKSGEGGRATTLRGHTEAVALAAQTLFGTPGAPSRLCASWLRFFRVDRTLVDQFIRHLLASAALHDLGKANDGFQSAVKGCGRQAIRHEHLSALLLWQEPVRVWLRAERLDAEMVIAAVASHHLKVNSENFASPTTVADNPSFCVYTSVLPALATAMKFRCSEPPAGGEHMWTFAGDVVPQREPFLRGMNVFKKQLRKDNTRLRLLLAVKAALIAADSVGSASVRMPDDLVAWLRHCFPERPLTAEDVRDHVIQPRIRELQQRGTWRGFHDFQEAAGGLGSRALLLSGCGSGKTLAAWRWIAAQLERQPSSRVIFLYPTRGTATEGFRDYVSWAGGERASLISGTARHDLEGMFGNPSDPRSNQDFTTPERLYALGHWPRRIFSGTVDSFLAFINNQYAAVCLLPVLADSVLVIDEVHSFDQRMFRSLVRFLQFFDVPALCMTASLPPRRIKVLQDDCGLQLFPGQAEQFKDLEQQALVPRYRVHTTDASGADEIALSALAEGKRVLWVMNTVARCQAAAKRVAKAGNVLCYHSRFRLRDRHQRHDTVVAAFQSARGPVLVCATQVCEMSLDLDADVLITEAAAVPALIQRMGRCCRESIPSRGRIGEVYVYEPEGYLPYSRDEVREGARFAAALATEETVCQASLADYLATLDTELENAGGFTGFLDSTWYAMSRDDAFREDDAYTVDCVLDSDVAAYLRTRREHRGQEAAYILPVPLKAARQDPRLGLFVRVADAGQYDDRFGFEQEG